jgi:hypothetical protein
MSDDLTHADINRLREQEDPWNDPATRRDLLSMRDQAFWRQQRELHEKVNGSWPEPRSADDRLAQANDVDEPQTWMGPYKDIGIQQVELAQIKDIPERDTLAFERTTKPEMIQGFHKLALIEQQPEAERLQFCQQRDAAQQLADRESYQHVYDCFYGNDSSGCIKLAQVPGGYQIDSGRHRVYVARELGRASVPARVYVPDRRS